MTKPPLAKPEDYSTAAAPSLGTAAAVDGAKLALTASAARHAARSGLSERLEALRLGTACLVGDLVTLDAEGESQDFRIMRRRWIAGGKGAVLELTIDYPAGRA
ncbi:hypothetical protein [Aquamicrobium sp. LC103]|uniref:hypothetical protein n=1 Tax=Aquamicrobium sp. LC103 TaxID=1120658 RepID=UPI0009E45683|nr:hypothetical protein [Aquamicrobium sp. LC103]TKT81426.1 hypothetical protein XW59_006075 [Aquamicrobium sp. LC103]